MLQSQVSNIGVDYKKEGGKDNPSRTFQFKPLDQQTEKGEGDIEGNNLDGIDDEMKEKPKKKFVWFENIEC